MSVEAVIGQYVKLQEVKDGLDFPDNVDDEELIVIIKEANQDIEVKLRPFATTLPLTDGTPNFKASSRAGLIYVNARWKEKKHNFELSAKLDQRYELKIKDIQQALKTEPTVRTQSVIVSDDPRDKKLPLPAQYDIFVFDDFA